MYHGKWLLTHRNTPRNRATESVVVSIGVIFKPKQKLLFVSESVCHPQIPLRDKLHHLRRRQMGLRTWPPRFSFDSLVICKWFMNITKQKSRTIYHFHAIKLHELKICTKSMSPLPPPTYRYFSAAGDILRWAMG